LSRETWLVVLLYVALTLLLAYPISMHPSTLRFPTGPDGDLGMYLLGWNTHAFLDKPWAIFDANIYYPQRLTLAYGENVIGISLFAAPVIWITDDLLLAANFVALLSCVLCGLGAYVLARRLGLSVAAAVLCGVIFECSPPRFFRVTQMNLSSVQWIPFALASLHAYLDEGRKRDLRVAAGFFSLQALSSGHGAVFMSVTLALFGAYRILLGEPLRLFRRVRDLGVTGVLLLAPAVLVFLPYLAVQDDVGLRRGLGSWTQDLTSFLASPSHVHAFLLSAVGAARVNQTAQAYLFPGYVPLLLALVALAWPRLGRSRRETPPLAIDRGPTGPGDGSADPVVADVDGATRPERGVGTPGAWTRVALLADLGAVASAVLGLVVIYAGSIRWKVGPVVILTARDAFRPWMFFAICVIARLAILRRAPLHARRRLFTWWSAVAPLARGGWKAWRPAMASVVRLPAVTVRLARLAWVRLGPVRRWASVQRTDATGFYGVLTAVMFGLALGPPYGLWRYVYSLPGFNFIRVSSRFSIVLVLGLAVLAAIGFDRLTAGRTRRIRTRLAVIVGALLVAEFAAMPMRAVPSNLEVPAIDRWLDTKAKPFVIAELPLPSYDYAGAFERQQVAYMIHSTAHWQKTIHGYSGWRTAQHMDLYKSLEGFPDETSLRNLAEIGVTDLVVHTDRYPSTEWPKIEERIGHFQAWLTLEHVEGGGRVYSLRAPRAATSR
jgi:hypothetical protein